MIGGRLDGYVPPFAQRKMAAAASAFFEKAGDRWWPIAGGVYYLRATKRVLGMRVHHAGVGAPRAAQEGAARPAARAGARRCIDDASTSRDAGVAE